MDFASATKHLETELDGKGLLWSFVVRVMGRSALESETMDKSPSGTGQIICCRNLGLKVLLLYGEMKMKTDSKILVY